MTALTKITGVLPDGHFDGEAVHVIASPEQLFAWAEHAKSGERFLYGTRCVFSPKGEGVRAAMNLAERGLVNLCQRPVAGRRERNYEAQRTSRRWPGIDPVAQATDGDLIGLGDETAAVNKVLPILKRAAQFGRPCPTDTQLASQANIRADDVQAVLGVLRAINAIRITSAPAPTCRIVTIVETGHCTGAAR
ncbi:hypothetical protein SAMN05192583_1403 [Sphingomonas gellani]|uniref:Uncharacterized protein n=1 Tax=Sphingomonas gellani TaxID=1166340 RepID=A0A1H8C0Q6_9SPHN|nr:hypothetical protein [Sphingomonas gellani]SEM88582.1 hypothetical protein SAMN05192583_1403 [Sphingomonas gellani]